MSGKKGMKQTPGTPEERKLREEASARGGAASHGETSPPSNPSQGNPLHPVLVTLDDHDKKLGLPVTWSEAIKRQQVIGVQLANDQARLGDRFIRVMMDRPDDDTKRDVMRRVGFTALRSVLVTSNCSPNSQRDEVSARAYRMTGGYVDHLRDDPAKLLSRVRIEDEDAIVDGCGALAEFTADLRARPNLDARKTVEATKELPFRLQHQFVRLAACLAVVTDRWAVDDYVMRIVRKVAVDTSHGPSLNVVRVLHASGEQGESTPRLSLRVGIGEDRLRTWMRFLCAPTIAIVEAVELESPVTGLRRVRWRLTERMTRLADAVLPVPVLDPANLSDD